VRRACFYWYLYLPRGRRKPNWGRFQPVGLPFSLGFDSVVSSFVISASPITTSGMGGGGLTLNRKTFRVVVVLFVLFHLVRGRCARLALRCAYGSAWSGEIRFGILYRSPLSRLARYNATSGCDVSQDTHTGTVAREGYKETVRVLVTSSRRRSCVCRPSCVVRPDSIVVVLVVVVVQIRTALACMASLGV